MFCVSTSPAPAAERWLPTQLHSPKLSPAINLVTKDIYLYHTVCKMLDCALFSAPSPSSRFMVGWLPTQLHSSKLSPAMNLVTKDICIALFFNFDTGPRFNHEVLHSILPISATHHITPHLRFSLSSWSAAWQLTTIFQNCRPKLSLFTILSGRTCSALLQAERRKKQP